MKKLLDSLHSKILKSKFAEEVTEAEIDALVKAKQGLNENKQSLNDGWIPCSERLPKDEKQVLTTLTHTYPSCHKMYSIGRCLYFDGERHWLDERHGYLEWDKYSDGRGGDSSYKVIAWQPLPEPYKGE